MTVVAPVNWNYQTTFWQPQNNGGRPRNCARILLDNALERGTLWSVADATQLPNINPGFPLSNVLQRDTYTYWTPSTWSPNFGCDLDNPETVNCLVIARHNLGTLGLNGRLRLWRTGASVWDVVVNLTPKDNGPIVVAFRPTEVTRIQLQIFTGGFPIVGVWMVGRAIEMERPLRASMQPVALSRQTDVTPQISNNGQLLSQVKVRKGVQVAPEWNHLSGAFYRSTLKPLARAMPGTPFGFIWNPEYAPDEGIYGVLTGDPRGSHIRAVDRYTFGFNMQGVVPA